MTGKTNEIPELAPAIAHLDLIGQVVTLDALHTQAETARRLAGDKKAHYLWPVKANMPSLLEAVAAALAGPDGDVAGASWTEQGKGHGRRERRSIRVAPADGIDWPHAAQVFRIRRDSGPTHGCWEHKEIAYGITSLPAELAGPRHLAVYAPDMLVMARFYEMWRDPAAAMPAAEALRQAQVWVRDASNGAKHARFPECTPPRLRDMPAARRSFWEAANSHAHPRSWAAFAFYGA